MFANVSDVRLIVLNPMLGSGADDGIRPQPGNDIRALSPSHYSASVMAPDICKVDSDRRLDLALLRRTSAAMCCDCSWVTVCPIRHLLIPFIGTDRVRDSCASSS